MGQVDGIELARWGKLGVRRRDCETGLGGACRNCDKTTNGPAFVRQHRSGAPVASNLSGKHRVFGFSCLKAAALLQNGGGFFRMQHQVRRVVCAFV